MKKLFCFILLFLIACTSGSVVEFPSGTRVNVELAITPEEKTVGLMNREHLEENAGMLFISEDERMQTFWMKNTLIPLDLIFMANDGTVVDIKKEFEPCKTVSCPNYASKAPAQYVLEVNAGFSEKEGLEIGNKLKISLK